MTIIFDREHRSRGPRNYFDDDDDDDVEDDDGSELFLKYFLELVKLLKNLL